MSKKTVDKTGTRLEDMARAKGELKPATDTYLVMVDKDNKSKTNSEPSITSTKISIQAKAFLILIAQS